MTSLKFKVGDRVIIMYSPAAESLKGMRGVVVDAKEFMDYEYTKYGAQTIVGPGQLVISLDEDPADYRVFISSVYVLESVYDSPLTKAMNELD